MTAARDEPAWPSNEELLAEIEAVSEDSATVQHQVLQRILEKHGSCHYLQKLGLDERTTLETFKDRVPLSTAADYLDDIEKILDGNKEPLLFCSLPIAFLRSSGTSAGKTKYFPVTEESAQGLLLKHPRAITQSCFPSKLPPGVGRTGIVHTAGKRQDTKSGAKASTVVTRCLDTEEFEYFHKHVAQIASPIEVLRAEDIHQSMYGHLLCLLAQADVVESIESVFAYSMAELFRSLEAWWPSLCHDIRTADVNKDIVTDSVIREAILSTVLTKPLPDIADRIQQEFKEGQRNGIVLRLFPNLQYLLCISTGPMKPFSAVLDRYTSKDFPKLAFGYGCSEVGHCAFPLKKTLHDPEAFCLWPKLAFYEFLPVAQDEEARAAEIDGVAGAVKYREEQKAVELTQVKLGQKYELVLTTSAGLYRYRTEDILQVTDFYMSLPIFKFVCRKGVMLSINTDKTDEAELQNVVNKAAGRLEQGLDVPLANYSSFADHSTTPGHYVIYWELENQPAASPSDAEKVLQECCDILDSSLNEPYRRGRKNKSISPLELKLVKQGTFTTLRNYAVQRGSNLSQYKTPRCVVNPALSEILNEGVENSFRSSFTAWENVQNVGLKTL